MIFITAQNLSWNITFAGFQTLSCVIEKALSIAHLLEMKFLFLFFF